MTVSNDVERRLLDLLAKMAIDGNLGLPVTTLTQTAHVGTDALQFAPRLNLNSVSRILEGARPVFYDGLQEPEPPTLMTLSDDGSSATLETTTYTGLSDGTIQVAHANGTPLVFGLADHAPWDMSDQLQLGDPLVFVTATERQDVQMYNHAGGHELYSVHLQVNRRFDRPSGDIHPERWARYVDKATKADVEAIASMLLENQEMITEFEEGIAVKLGGLSDNVKDAATFGPAPMKRDGSSWAYAGVLQFTVVGDGATF